MELDSSFLQDHCAVNFAALQALMLHSKRVLWVAMGEDPAMQAEVGYLRVLQNENVDLDLRYLLLKNDAGDTARLPESITRIVAAMASSPTADREYIELDGSIQINRWIDGDRLSSIMGVNDGSSTSELMRVGGTNIPLRIQGSIYSTVEDSRGDFLAADEVHGHSWPWICSKLLPYSYSYFLTQRLTHDSHPSVSALGFSGVITKSATPAHTYSPETRSGDVSYRVSSDTNPGSSVLVSSHSFGCIL
jgi:hypothetical protein